MAIRASILWKAGAVLAAVFFPTGIFANTVPDDAQKPNIVGQTLGVQVPFIKNMGQIRENDVCFYAQIWGGTVFVERQGILTYQLRAEDAKGVVIQEVFTDKGLEITGLEPSTTTVSCFKGNQKADWKSHIPTYMGLHMGEICEGVDLRLRAYGSNVEKLFQVLPGQRPEAIRIAIRGAEEIAINSEGQLVLHTQTGPVTFTRPLAFQTIDGKDKPVQVAYAVYGAKAYGFKVGDYDRESPLIIDPLLQSTFIGGGQADHGNAIALDGDGNVYVAGYTGSSDYPTTTGDDYADDFDVFVSKFDPELSTLLASTFLGGGDRDWGNAIALDGDGNVYVAGETSSKDFPINLIAAPYDHEHNDEFDAFVTKLDKDLGMILASTFIGGRYDDHGHGIAIDGSGNVFVTGKTASPDFPTSTTQAAYDDSFNETDGKYEYDVFISKFDNKLSNLLASTFLGGAAPDIGWAIALDAAGYVYVTGQTLGADFPMTSYSYDRTHNGDNSNDVFVSKLDNNLIVLWGSTYIGGTSGDFGRSIALDDDGYIYVTGQTTSSDYPTTECAYDETYNQGYDVFVSKFDNGLGRLEASTFIGGAGLDFGNAIAVVADASKDVNYVYVTGMTASSDYPSENKYNEPSVDDGIPSYDAFVSKLDGDLAFLLDSTFIGGKEDESGNAIAVYVDGNGDTNVYVAGETESSGFPTILTPKAYDDTHNGGYDVFVSRFDRMYDTPESVPVAKAGADQTVDEGAQVTLDGSGSYDCDGDIASYQWEDITGDEDLEVELSGATEAQPAFVAPQIDQDKVDQDQATLTFQLTVTDSDGLTDTATVRVSLTNIPESGEEGAESTTDVGSTRGCFVATLCNH